VKIAPKDFYLFLKSLDPVKLIPYDQYEAVCIAAVNVYPENGYSDSFTEYTVSRSGSRGLFSDCFTVVFRDGYGRLHSRSVPAEIRYKKHSSENLNIHICPVTFSSETPVFQVPFGPEIRLRSGRSRTRLERMMEPIEDCMFEHKGKPEIPLVVDLRGDLLRYLEQRNPLNRINTQETMVF